MATVASSDVARGPLAGTHLRAAVVRPLRAGAYSMYPHSVAYFDAGRQVVLGEQFPDGTSRIFAYRFADGGERELCRFPVPSLWADIALDADVLAVVAQERLWVMDPNDLASLREVYHAPAGLVVNGLCSISRDGSKVLLTTRPGGKGGAGVLVDVASGRATTFVEHDWWADHFVFSPFDDSWAAYGWQSWTTPRYKTHGNLSYVWHAEQAPHGRQAFDQVTGAADPARPLHTTHDRCAFDELAYYTIVYPDSPGGPRGLWLVPVDGRPPRLVSASPNDWHCDVTRDGKWAVVDTIGPWGDPRGAGHSIVLVEVATGRRQELARCHSKAHPYHPHPTFSPDGRTILFNSIVDGAPLVQAIDLT
ncbi:MAG TPA: hypothetical protein VK324_02745 [Tepidisphaeraceae bacterium]|nr:hypothetical protein [Tepidisphaeraceae bacterium]